MKLNKWTTRGRNTEKDSSNSNKTDKFQTRDSKSKRTLNSIREHNLIRHTHTTQHTDQTHNTLNSFIWTSFRKKYLTLRQKKKNKKKKYNNVEHFNLTSRT